MMGSLHLSCLLLLLCASHPSSADFTTNGNRCSPREGTPFTVIMDYFYTFWSYDYYIEMVLNRVSARFPCVTRQYTSVTVDLDEVQTNVTSDKESFLQSIRGNSSRYWDSINNMLRCNQSLLSGLKKALEVSPAEALILVFSFGSISDATDAALLSDVLTLLDAKKPQIFFFVYPYFCGSGTPQQKVLEDIASVAYGDIIYSTDYDYSWVINSMDVLLYKPLNSSTHILSLNISVINSTYEDAFSVVSSLSHLLVITDGKFHLLLTDPYGNQTELMKSSSLYRYQAPHLITSPQAGSWHLTASGDGHLDVKILGFMGSETSGSCSESDCHPYATCDEFGGGHQCTCKKGFTGDGRSCTDMNECINYYDSGCDYLSCVNTVGSYSCNCWPGSVYEEGFGCIDIDECANSSLNDCHPWALCRNIQGSYICTCYSGYYGDGRHCEVNECERGTPCPINEECIKTTGSYFCLDPCTNYTELNEAWRSTSNTNYSEGYAYSWYSWMHCDYNLHGWYRFKGVYDQKMPEHCVPAYSCGTAAPMWLNGLHPAIEDGIVNRTACASSNYDCCSSLTHLSVKMCPGGYHIYKILGTPYCYTAYCTEQNYSCSTMDCASDEECRIVNGVQGCHCKETVLGSSDALSEYLKPEVICGLEYVQITFNKCQLENLGYDTSSIHLRDIYCRGIIERSDQSYVTITTPTINGYCGAYIMMNDSGVTYMNTVYLAAQYDGVIVRNDYPIDLYCLYPLNMEISLLTAINSFTSSAEVSVGGTANYTITMGLFQDSSYSIPYTGPEVWLPSTGKMYVGVMASGASGSSQFVLIMTNCYATPTPDKNSAIRYDIIKNRCPNRNDPTISVPENGASLKGRFSIQVFKFLNRFSSVYLHCQVGLCNKGVSSCSTGCASRASSTDDNFSVKNFTLGPIYQKEIPPTAAVADTHLSPSSDAGPAAPLAKLMITVLAFLLTFF